MRYLLFLFLLLSFSAKAQIPVHCGYDFNSYFVLNVHESGKIESVHGLKISIVNALGIEIVNAKNEFSWVDAEKPMLFTSNYKVDDYGKKITADSKVSKERWNFPFAKDHYLLSVKSTFPADDFSVKIEDVDGDLNGSFKTQFVKLAPYNMYVLCSSKAREVQFGPKGNRPIDIVLERK